MPTVESRKISGKAGVNSPFSYVPEAQDYLRESRGSGSSSSRRS